ncbi:protein SPEAR1-like [Curcuma longa]|uniref:protein SPEAR1-like n=1 Tax=Curcuma longa TaxID=136217 RepID=UPI003D9EEC96
MEGRSYLHLGSGSRSSGSRKGKKSSSEKAPKQPQRGLGVAQLEKIRLEDQMKKHISNYHNDLNMEDSRVDLGSSSYALHPNDMRGSNYGDYWPNPSTSSQGLSSTTSFQYYKPPSTITLPLFGNYQESSSQKTRHERRQPMASFTQTSDSSNEEELDLELRLSL